MCQCPAQLQRWDQDRRLWCFGTVIWGNEQEAEYCWYTLLDGARNLKWRLLRLQVRYLVNWHLCDWDGAGERSVPRLEPHVGTGVYIGKWGTRCMSNGLFRQPEKFCRVLPHKKFRQTTRHWSVAKPHLHKKSPLDFLLNRVIGKFTHRIFTVKEEKKRLKLTTARKTIKRRPE